jgi:hypothetical protein
VSPQRLLWLIPSCVFTSRDMVFVGLRGIVYIVRNYAEVLREVTKLEPLEREAYMADHTFALTHLESVVEELAVCADRVAVFCNDVSSPCPQCSDAAGWYPPPRH